MNAARRAELRHLADAATPGPWLAAVGQGRKRRRQQYAVLGVESLRGQGERGALAVFAGLNEHRADDAELAAAARTAIPELLEALDRVERLADELEAHCPGGPHRLCIGGRLRAAIQGTT